MSEKHPEAKLLDLIRGQSSPKSGDEPLEKLRRGTGRAAALVRSAGPAIAQGIRGINPLKALNAVLAVLVGLSFIYYVSVWSASEKKRFVPELIKDPASLKASKPRQRRYSSYVRAVKSRDLFGGRVVEVRAPRGPTAAQRARGLRLLGFLEAGGDTTAVIYDKGSRMTHYIKKGDSIRGLQVDSVGSGRVVLTREGERVFLSL